jgi:5-methylcytosine-specific restriction endonuclease McrA
MLYKVHPYPTAYGTKEGKTHKVDNERPGLTFCGKKISEMPGAEIEEGEIDCKLCFSAIETRKKSAEWVATIEQRAIEREIEKAAWWKWYNQYLLSPQWMEKRRLVFDRCRGLCEGCRNSKAVQVHHLTYVRVGDEMLFDLVAVCLDCHEKIHPEIEERLEGHIRMMSLK